MFENSNKAPFCQFKQDLCRIYPTLLFTISKS